MEQSYKKRPPCATANSPLGLPDMEKLLYKSGKFLYYSYIRLTLENSISFSDSIAFVK